MKKYILTLLIIVYSVSTHAQQHMDPDYYPSTNELKINMSNLIGFKWFDVSYENILNEESSIGIGMLFSLDDEQEGLEEYRTFSVTPYYRHFLSRGYAEGFFVEAFTMIHSGKDEDYDYDNTSIRNNNDEKYTDFAVGVSVGTKYVTRRGFVAEVYAGIGRDMLGNSDIEIVGRGGVSIGFRF
ncbi:MAG TPA: hypothetical protein VJ970_01505 [Flavobacteriaceae bacterium]|nr:hypothetical protein [Flavobacteriaceae bacterium]